MIVLVDTSAFYAAMSDTDHNHADAQRIWQALVRGGHEMVVASPVLLETVALLQRRRGLGVVRLLREALDASAVVVWLNEELHNAAWDELERVNRRRVSLVDCAAAALGRSAGITHIFAFDPHFEDWGLKLLTIDDLTDPDADA